MISGSDIVRSLNRCVLLSCLWLANPTWAQGPSEAATDSHTRTAARSLAAQGAEAFENQEYLVALDFFQRAGALVEAPTILLMEARTLVELRRWVEAADKYSIARNMKSNEDENSTFQMAVQVAGEELERLRERIPLLNVQLRQQAKGSSPQVWIDGRQLPEPLVGVPNPVDPGEHRVEVKVDDQLVETRDVLMREGDREELVIELSPPRPMPVPTAPPPPTPKAAPTPAPVAETGSSTSNLGWVTLGTGAVFTAVGMGTGLAALGKKSDLDEVCDPACPRDREDDITSFRRYRTLSYASFALGAAGLAWGSYVLWLGPREETMVGLRVGPASAMVEGAF